jgi:hypothetical protein
MAKNFFGNLETINRKTLYTHEKGCTLSITEKRFWLMYYSRFRKEVGILNLTNIFLDKSHYMSINDVGIKKRSALQIKHIGKKI